MQDPRTPLFARDDTFFGVCQALGDDFGFNPLWLRILFAVPLMFVPVAAIAAYFGLGAIVLLSRLLAPRPRRQRAAKMPASTPAAANEGEQLPLPIAA